ncbi:MAG: hypothetical protein HOE86_27270, partial [Gemmatimonadetes bacterium]|nr:hypothetical protein [Gemmatimonadota bacterium]
MQVRFPGFFCPHLARTGSPIAHLDRKQLLDLNHTLRWEWLEPNGLGGWAASTVAGAHTRRYHGL